jgi:hypothetical protein
MNSFMIVSSSRMASLLQQDSTRMFPIPLRMYRNAFASLGTHPADVPYAITVVGNFFILVAAISNADERIATQR